MAEIFRQKGIKFIIYSDDHDPAHCQAKSAEFEVKIDISGDEPTLMSVSVEGSKESKFQKNALKAIKRTESCNGGNQRCSQLDPSQL